MNGENTLIFTGNSQSAKWSTRDYEGSKIYDKVCALLELII